MYKFCMDLNKKEINSIQLCNAHYFHIFNRYSGVAKNDNIEKYLNKNKDPPLQPYVIQTKKLLLLPTIYMI